MQSGLISWHELLGAEKQKDYFQGLLKYIQTRREQGVSVFPIQADVFNAFALTPPNELKVVILGQDPYHGAGQAHGLSFSVKDGTKIPPSLRNMYKELVSDIDGFRMPQHGNLTHWAEQGVLLLNAVLTVEKGQANSHQAIGWESFTNTVITQISEQLSGIIFLLWGRPAQQKIKLIDASKHSILTSAHPSPLSAYRGFLGCQHFSQTNRLLIKLGKQPIDWQVP